MGDNSGCEYGAVHLGLSPGALLLRRRAGGGKLNALGFRQLVVQSHTTSTEPQTTEARWSFAPHIHWAYAVNSTEPELLIRNLGSYLRCSGGTPRDSNEDCHSTFVINKLHRSNSPVGFVVL